MGTPLSAPFAFIIHIWDLCVSFLSSITLNIGGYSFNYFYFILAGIVLSMLINYFWPGLRG